jgi:hypothetical protein
MNENIFGDNFSVICADGITREGCSLTVFNESYAYLDSEGKLLEGERAVVTTLSGSFAVTPYELAIITKEYGPLNI